MSCDRCLALSTMTVEVGRIAGTRDQPAIGRDGLRGLRRACAQHGITAVCRCERQYPRSLMQLSDPPHVLYVRGNLELVCADHTRALGVVGTRRPTTAGREAARRIGAGFAGAGGVVVSGMALGVDGAAHDGALSVRGSTIAVLAGGVDRPTPYSHARLYQRILEHGAVVSELPPGVEPRKWTFPARNRLIAALSGAVLVVEAPRMSGALITVDHANDLGRETYAVPGSTIAPTCEGSNAMLIDGANVALDGAQVASEMGLGGVTGTGPQPETAAGREIHAALARGPRSVGELATRASSLGPGDLELLLLDLELAGWIVREPDGRYAQLLPWAA